MEKFCFLLNIFNENKFGMFEGDLEMFIDVFVSKLG